MLVVPFKSRKSGALVRRQHSPDPVILFVKAPQRSHSILAERSRSSRSEIGPMLAEHPGQRSHSSLSEGTSARAVRFATAVVICPPAQNGKERDPRSPKDWNELQAIDRCCVSRSTNDWMILKGRLHPGRRKQQRRSRARIRGGTMAQSASASRAPTDSGHGGLPRRCVASVPPFFMRRKALLRARGPNTTRLPRRRNGQACKEILRRPDESVARVLVLTSVKSAVQLSPPKFDSTPSNGA